MESGIIMFASRVILKCIFDYITVPLIDGTFKCSPKYFYLMYTYPPQNSTSTSPWLAVTDEIPEGHICYYINTFCPTYMSHDICVNP